MIGTTLQQLDEVLEQYNAALLAIDHPCTLSRQVWHSRVAIWANAKTWRQTGSTRISAYGTGAEAQNTAARYVAGVLCDHVTGITPKREAS